MGDLPRRFLVESQRNASKTLSKAALTLGPGGLSEQMTVSEYTRIAAVEVVDLRI